MTPTMDSLVDLAKTIAGRGIPTALDPRDLDAPGALVELNRLGTDTMLCGDVTALASVYLVAPDNGRVEATGRLLEMYELVKDLTTGAEPVDLALPDTAPLPALRLNPIDLT